MLRPEQVETLALFNCRPCRGSGLLPDKTVCTCVCRAVFRQAHGYFDRCAAMMNRPVMAHWGEEISPGIGLPAERWREDYRADFYMAAVRALGKVNARWKLFQAYHLEDEGRRSPATAARQFGISERYFFEQAATVSALVGAELCRMHPSILPAWLADPNGPQALEEVEPGLLAMSAGGAA